MIPIRFGDRQRQLFGMYHPPTGSANGRYCVVLCNPFGQEVIRSHRLLKVLGDRLSRAGFPVLRFDYFGTGDSDGDDTEGDLETWVEDLLRANDEVTRRSGCGASAWFGLRLGATIVALAAAKVPVAPRRLVLWDPVVDGTAYLRELQKAHAAALLIDSPSGLEIGDASTGNEQFACDGPEALGFPLTRTLRRQIGDLSAASWAACQTASVSLIGNTDNPELSTVAKLLRQAGTTVEMRQIESRIDWASEEAMDTAIVPADGLQAVMAALQEAT
ncbi:MAG: alpha/beta hydrolase [Betaproteobacteria bacterium]|nr:alpha/beta hydrolase [Betaproteobacteria bacterium]